MLCEQAQEHLSAYLDKELTADLSAALRDHLGSCAACRALLADLRATADLLGRLPAREAPDHLAQDVQRDIERRAILPAGPSLPQPLAERTLPLHRARFLPRIAAVAAAVLLAVGIGLLAFLSATRQAPTTTQSDAQALHEGIQVADASKAGEPLRPPPAPATIAIPRAPSAAPATAPADRKAELDYFKSPTRSLGSGEAGDVSGRKFADAGAAAPGFRSSQDGFDRAPGKSAFAEDLALPSARSTGGGISVDLNGGGYLARGAAAAPAVPEKALPKPAVSAPAAKPAAPREDPGWVMKTAPAGDQLTWSKPTSPATPAAPGAPPAPPAQALSKSGAGTIVASGANTYSGGTTVTAGTLQVPPATTTAAAALAAATASDGPRVIQRVMNAVADGEVGLEDLRSVATRENLRPAGYQLVLRTDSRQEANRTLEQLFRANGWAALGQTRTDADVRTPPWKPGEKGRDAEREKQAGKPGAAGVYFRTHQNGEDTWLVLTDRDNVSRFGSQLAQADRVTVGMDSSAPLRPIGELQSRLRQLAAAPPQKEQDKANKAKKDSGTGDRLATDESAAGLPGPAKAAGRPDGYVVASPRNVPIEASEQAAPYANGTRRGEAKAPGSGAYGQAAGPRESTAARARTPETPMPATTSPMLPENQVLLVIRVRESAAVEAAQEAQPAAKP